MIDQEPAVSTIRELVLVDRDLSLRFDGIREVSAPDTEIHSFCFTMVNTQTKAEMGGINIKRGYTDNIVKYRGNIGFTVHESFRGHHYSARSCLLLGPVIALLGMTPIWLTCSVDNVASRKNLERIGAVYSGTVNVPEKYFSYYPEHARVKHRFRWEPLT